MQSGIDYARMAAVQESFGEAYLKATKANQSIESHYEIPFYVALSASGDHHSEQFFCAASGETYSGIRVVGKRLRALSRNHHQSPLQHKRPVDHCAFPSL